MNDYDVINKILVSMCARSKQEPTRENMLQQFGELLVVYCDQPSVLAEVCANAFEDMNAHATAAHLRKVFRVNREYPDMEFEKKGEF